MTRKKKRRSFGSPRITHANLARGAMQGYKIAMRTFHRDLKAGHCKDALLSLVWLTSRGTQMREHARHARAKPFKARGSFATHYTKERLAKAFAAKCMR